MRVVRFRRGTLLQFPLRSVALRKRPLLRGSNYGAILIRPFLGPGAQERPDEGNTFPTGRGGL